MGVLSRNRGANFNRAAAAACRDTNIAARDLSVRRLKADNDPTIHFEGKLSSACVWPQKRWIPET